MLVEQALKADIISVITGNKGSDGADPSAAIEEFAEKLAAAITKHIKTATVDVTVTVPIIPVQVAVPAGTGATTAPMTAKGTGIIS